MWILWDCLIGKRKKKKRRKTLQPLLWRTTFLLLSHVLSPIVINKSLLFVGIQSSATPPKTPQDSNNDVSILNNFTTRYVSYPLQR